MDAATVVVGGGWARTVVIVPEVDVADGSVGVKRLGGERGGNDEDAKVAPSDKEALGRLADDKEGHRTDDRA